VEKYYTAGQATDDNMTHALCKGYTQKLRICNIVALPLQQWLQERSQFLRYTYMACLV
jgi:hypothetical protein